jgi:hypothetical protein
MLPPARTEDTLRWSTLPLALALPLLLAGSPVAAQADAPAPANQNVISANPFLLIAAWFNAEYERAVTATSTVGARVSTLSIGIDDPEGDNDAEYSSGRVFWRYYPKVAFEGLYFGLDAGVTSLDDGDETHTVLGGGFELGYNWLLGRRKGFYLSLGAGADRPFGGDLGDASAVIPTVRIINVGVAF